MFFDTERSGVSEPLFAERANGGNADMISTFVKFSILATAAFT